MNPSGPDEPQGTATFSWYYASFTFALAMVTWIVFSGQFDGFHLTLGLIASAVVAATGNEIAVLGRNLRLGQMFLLSIRFVQYLSWLLVQILLANIHVFRLAISPHVRSRISPSIVTFKTTLRSDIAKFVLANSITLTPGTVTVKIEAGVFVIHAIDPVAATGLQDQMERRVAWLFKEET